MGDIVFEARTKNYVGVRQALEQGADVDQQNEVGDTALLWAVANRQPELIRLLLENGADVHLANPKNSTTALGLASSGSYTEGVQLLQNAVAVPRKTKESWKKMGAATMAHVGVYPEIGERLTSVFNFASRERYIISQGLVSGNKAVSPATSFDALPQAVVTEALEQFTKQGGVADRDFVLNGASALAKPKLRVAGN